MNILGNAFNIPVVTYGPGNPHTSHTADERIQIDEYVSSIDVFIRALFHMNRFHHNKKLNSSKGKI
jgi:LysW-gamma-L-lysine carboxypeptidase